MILRLAKQNDLDRLIVIHKNTINSAWFESDFVSAIENQNDKIVFSVLEQEKIIGYIMVAVLPPEADILNIAIDTDNQSNGYGSKALDALVSELQNRKVKNIFLEVREKSRAVQYYLKNNFTIIGTREQYYSDGENALRMLREI